MRWALTAVFLACLVYPALSTEADDGEPSLHIMARSTVYNVDETKAIFCQGAYLIETIDWLKPNGEKVQERSPDQNRVFVERKINETHSLAVLIMHELSIEDGGNWTCKAGDLSETREIIVGKKVNIPYRNVVLEGEEGKSIKMTCEANDGYPPPVVVWYKNNTSIVSDHKKHEIKKDNTLEIRKLDHTDVGTYVCKVRQKALSYYTDKTVQLTVQHKPILYNSFTQALYTSKYKTEEVYAIINSTKNITCSAIANPPPTYRWVRRINGYDSDIMDTETVFTSPDGTSSVLELRLYDKSYMGEYKCSANNSRGSESIVFHVNPGTPPPAPDYVSFLKANSSYLTFNVSCSECNFVASEDVSPDPENLTVLGYTFQIVPLKAEYPADWDNAQEIEVDIEGPEDTIFYLGPFSNSTKFHVRISSRNAAGSSEYIVVEQENIATTDAAYLTVASYILAIFAIILVL